MFGYEDELQGEIADYKDKVKRLQKAVQDGKSVIKCIPKSKDDLSQAIYAFAVSVSDCIAHEDLPDE